MIYRLLILLAFSLASFSLAGQSLEDAVRYTLLNNQSTARSIGTGSAIGPMGVDFGAFVSNPAGLARLRYSEASLSFGANYSSVNASYQGESFSNSQGNLAPVLNNLGLGFANQARGNRWKSKNFALSINRLADFNRTINLSDQTPGSITDRFLDLAEGSFPNDLDPFEAGLAFDVIAIDTIPGAPTSYFSDLAATASVHKAIEHETSGSLNELQISFAGNYDDKLLVGASLGLAFLDYTSERTHFEEDLDNNVDFFQDLTFTDRLQTIGAGVNAKLGLIYMPMKTLFISLSGQTPTWYLLTDTYETSLEYAFDASNGNEVFFGDVAPNEFEYRFKTPWRLTAGIGFIVGNKGFISGEVEFLDYTSSQFDLTRNIDNTANSEGTDLANEDIEAFLKRSMNIRVGGEYAINKFRVRGGFGLSGSPFNGSNEGTASASLGFGYRVNKLIIDLGFRGTIRNELYFPYFTFQPPQPIIDNQNLDIAAVLTIGTKF